MRQMIVGFLAAFGLLLGANGAIAGTHSEAQMPKPIEVGPAHAHFKAMAGKWTIKQTMFMPDGKTMTSEGSQTVQTVLGGLGMTFESATKMGPMTMAGVGSSFWVPGKKQYQSTWFDNMSHNGMWIGWGTWDEKTKTMTQTTTGPGPDGKEMSMKMVTVVKDNDNYTTTFFMKGPDGKEMKMMEMVYARAKG